MKLLLVAALAVVATAFTPAAVPMRTCVQSRSASPAVSMLFGKKAPAKPAPKSAKKVVTKAKKVVAKQAKAVAKKPVPKPVKKAAKAVAKAAAPSSSTSLGVVGSLIAGIYDSSPLSSTGMRGRENILKAAKRAKTSVPDVNIDNYQKYGPVGAVFEAIDLLRSLPGK